MTSTPCDSHSPATAGPPDRPTVARYVVAGGAPPWTEAVVVAEKVREALQRHSDGAGVFSGKTPDGAPLRGHGHAFVFCEAGGDGRLRHLTIYASMGFDERAREALGRLVKVWGHRPASRGGADLWLALAGVGRPEDFAGLDVAAGRCPLLDEARVWVSHTPFVPTRHLKVTSAGRRKLDERGLQIGSAEHDLRRLLAARGLEPVAVAAVDGARVGSRVVPWSAFRTRRARGGGRRSTAAGFGFRVEFAAPVRGPIAVGYGAHFGLGTFTPAGEDSFQVLGGKGN